MQETLVIVRQNNYWGSGKDLAEARKNYKKSSGRFPTSAASILAFTGDGKEIEKIEIDDVDGGIHYPKSLTKTTIQ